MLATVVVASIVAVVVLAINQWGFKGIVVRLLGLYKRVNLLALRLRGLTPDDVADARVVTGQSWDEFCDTLKAAGAAIVSDGTPKDAFNQAEGYRYLSRIVRAGLENFVEADDPYNPTLSTIADGLRPAPVKLGSDNPDNLYQHASILGTLTYRIVGNKGTVSTLGFGTQAGQYGKPGGLNTVDYVDSTDMAFHDDGSFEIILSAGERPADAQNWLRMETDPERGMLIVRQTFGRRDTETPATVAISVVGHTSGPQPLTAARLDEGLQSAATLVAAAPMMFARWAKGFQGHANKLPLFDQKLSDSVGGDPHIRYYHSYWELLPDQALVIEAQPPECKFWNFQLNNYWMESLDYRHFPIHVNKHTASYLPDGRLRIVVASSDPRKLGVDCNWIDTCRHTCGTMCFRWIRPQVPDDVLPHPTTKVVDVGQLPTVCS